MPRKSKRTRTKAKSRTKTQKGFKFSFPKIRVKLSTDTRQQKALLFILLILLLGIITDTLIQLYFRYKVVAFSPKGVVVTTKEVFNAFKDENTPVTFEVETQRVVAKKIVEKEAKRNGIVVTEDMVDQRIEEIKNQNNITLEDLLLQAGIDEKQLRYLIKMNIMLNTLVPINYEPSEEEIKTYYEENKDVFFGSKKLEEVKDTIKQVLTERYRQEQQNQWFLNKLDEYQLVYLFDSTPPYRFGAGINYFAPILLNNWLDTTLRTPLVSF